MNTAKRVNYYFDKVFSNKLLIFEVATIKKFQNFTHTRPDTKFIHKKFLKKN